MARKEPRIYTRKLKSGETRYDVTLDYTDPQHGKRVQRRQTFRTRKEAQQCLAQHRMDTARGHTAAPGKMTVAELMREWLDSRRPHVRDTTLEVYRVTVEHHIVPYLGSIVLTSLTARHLEQHYSKLRQSGLGPRAVQCVHQRIVQALNWAVKLRLVGMNEAHYAELPPYRAPEMRCWGDDQLARFLQVAGDQVVREFKTTLGPVWIVAVMTGLRRGELLGLRWDDVDEDEGVLHVRQSLAMYRGCLVPHPTKTDKPRKVAVPSSLFALLRRHRARQHELRLRLGDKWHDTGVIFTNGVGNPVDVCDLRENLNHLCDLAGVPRIRVHDIRHTHATWLLSRGRALKEVSERLGHANPNTTLRVYAHALPDHHRETAELIAREMTGAS